MDKSAIAYAGVGLGAVAFTYYATKSAPKIDPLYDFDQQSVEIDEIEHVRVATSVFNKPLVTRIDEGLVTLDKIMHRGMQVSGNAACLGFRQDGDGPYVWITYLEAIERCRFIGSGLLNKGIKAVNATNVGIYSKNRIEWTLCEFACYTYSLNVVSLYDIYGEESIKYILSQAEIPVVFLDSFERLQNVLKVADELPCLRLIVHFDDFNPKEYGSIKIPSKIELISISELMKIGRQDLRSPVPPSPNDLATICYTSGTTGNPKGAMLTHGNIVANVASFRLRLDRPHLKHTGANYQSPAPVHYSFLPLAHMMERTAIINMLLCGGRVGYISGDITSLLDDCRELKPNDMPLVPRILNKLYDRVKAQVADSKLKQALLKRAIASKEADRQRGVIRQDTIYDKLIFKKVRDFLGGNILHSATGSAPISKEVMEFSRAFLGCPIPEGYGQTEATCGITCCHPYEPLVGHTGPPLECVMVKLVDIAEMGYFAKDGKGEICAKGPTVFKGYFKDPEKTAETIDRDGWLHTGDVGQWLPNGCLKIIDRKKHLFKLSQGEYISPERVEHSYSRCPFIGQIFVDGDSLQDYCVAVVVPDEENLTKYCKNNNIAGTFKELCRNENIRKLIVNEMEVAAESSHLGALERVKLIYLHDELFSIQNGFLTPTLKLKRAELRKFFKTVFEALYSGIPAIAPKSKL